MYGPRWEAAEVFGEGAGGGSKAVSTGSQVLAAGRAGRASTAIWVNAAVQSMAYRHDLGLWAPAVGEQCILYSVLTTHCTGSTPLQMCVCVCCTGLPSCSIYSFMTESVRHSPVFQQRSRASTSYTSNLQPGPTQTHFCLHSTNSRGAIVKFF